MRQHWKHHVMILTIAGLLIQTGCSLFRQSLSEETTKPAFQDASGVQLSPAAVKNSELQMVTVGMRADRQPILTTGEIRADENRLFHISSFVNGRIQQDHAMLGDTISQGQTLAVVQNLEVARIQADFIHELHQNDIEIRQAKTRLDLALKSLNREKRLLAEGISPRKDYLQAETDVALAHSELRGKQEHATHLQAEANALLSAYGMTLDSLHSERIRTGSPIVAPRSGIVIKKNVTVGDMVTPDMILYEVADLSTVWLDMAVYPTDVSRIKPGQSIRFTCDGVPGKTFTGVVNYIPTASHDASQTFVARAFLDNPDGRLRPGMLGRVAIEQSSARVRPFVPKEAVQQYGKETFVFRDLGQGRFQKQPIKLGSKLPEGYLVNEGLSAGDKIVGQGSFTLKAELLKSQFAEEE